LFVLRSFFILLFCAACSASVAEVLDSVARIRALSAEDAAKRIPVSIEALVTFRNPAQLALIADDGREGIFVELPKNADPRIQTGARLRIEGTTQPGGFLPIITCQRATFLGTEPLPPPRAIDASELFSPALDCQWVQVPAIVTGVEPRKDLALIAEVSGWTIKLLLPNEPNAVQRAANLMQRQVIVHGVVGSVFNAKRQLTGRHFFVPSFEHLILSENETPAGEARLRAVDELLRSDSTARTRVRVRGVVTHATDDGLYLRGDGGSVFVRAANTSELTPGAQVEVEGFAAIAPFRPVLRAVRVQTLAQVSSPEPKPLDLARDRLVGLHAELVSIDADLLALRDGPDDTTTLQCRVGNWFFEASLPGMGPITSRLKPDDRLHLSGICELTTTSSLPFSTAVDGFRLQLRNGSDIQVIQYAPWWTLRRLLWALGIVGALALIAFAWAALLRRRVSEQTEIIRVQIERSAVKDERQRIARELHDTIEQELAGVSLQLRNARQRLVHAPEQVASSLDLAEKMLRHCRDEARSSIRDLRSVALEQRGLHGALQEFLVPLAAESGARFTFEIHGEPRSLPGPAEIHLLRIAHEAVANAARHSAAAEIRVHLTYEPEAVILEIRDNGRGFDPKAPAPRGHFGILGIHERANKLRATVSLESAPGAGTTIRVVLPVSLSTHTNGQVS
jgi:signal transduction histidine kinase